MAHGVHCQVADAFMAPPTLHPTPVHDPLMDLADLAPAPIGNPPIPRWSAGRFHAKAWPSLVARLGWVGRINPWLLLLLPALYLATFHALDGRLPVPHSFAPNMIWSHEWTEQFRQGIWYPRWMEHTQVGLGGPTFHFYGPLAFYAVLPFSLIFRLSPATSVLWSFWVALAVLALGMAWLMKALVPPRQRWLAGLIGAMAPLNAYALLDVYVRGSLSELWGMALFPWLVGALLRSLRSTSLGPRLGLAAAMALFSLCHPPMILMGSLSIGVALLLSLRGWKDVGRVFRRGILPMGVGLLADAFYLVSAILDQRHVNIQVMTEGSGSQPMNRFLINDLGRLTPKMADGFDGFMVPTLVACLVILVAGIATSRREGKTEQAQTCPMGFFAAMLSLSAFMMTDLSRGLYTEFPILNKIQFSWRWMAVLSVAALALLGLLLSRVFAHGRAAKNHWRIPILILAVWFSTQGASNILPNATWDRPYSDKINPLLAGYAADGKEPDASALPLKDCRDLLCLNAKNELLYNDVNEYRPLSQKDFNFPPRTFPEVEWAEGSGDIADVQWRPGSRRFSVDSPTGGRVLVRTTAWLGWEISVNGTRSVGDQAGDFGRMLVDVPVGKSNVAITYRGTPNQRLGNAISLGTLLVIAGAFAWRGRKNHGAIVKLATAR